MSNAILRNLQNGDLYKHIENQTYKNLRTGVSGLISDEVAGKVFVLNVDATFFFNDNPEVEKMIGSLVYKLGWELEYKFKK